MKKITMKIEGMSCPHCKMALETAIGQLQGVNAVDIDLDKNLAEIEVQNEDVAERIREAVEDAGYTPV